MAQNEDRVVDTGFDDDEDEYEEKKVNHQQKGSSSNRLSLKEEEASVERVFQHLLVPSWRNQLTVRAFVVSFFLSVLFTFIVMKLNLTTGIIPSLNVSAGLLGFFFVKTWTKFLEKSNMLKQPFTRQENTVIQTCVVASSGIAFSGGFGSYLFGMSEHVAKQSADTSDFKDPKLSWIIAFLFVVSFLGLFSVVPLRKIMVIDFKLTYPSGTATAHLINSFHTPEGAKLAKKQVKVLGRFFSISFLWGVFQWFYTASDGCGFQAFPSLGLKAFENKFYFDFSALYIGVGMICPYIINISVLLGGILSWGVMWPLIETREGHWYATGLGDSSLRGIQGYRVFIAIAMILGDGLYNFVKVLSHTLLGLVKQLRNKQRDNVLPVAGQESPESPKMSYDDQRRKQLFLKDQMPAWFAVGGYVAIAAISTATLPHIFPQLTWYHIIVIYLIAPTLAFCNAYGCGLTDWSLASTYGKLAIFTIGAWAGASHGGVIASLAACGVMMNIVSTASDLMQDFKTGYLTLASPRSMFISQIIGTAMGCVISPSVFWIFYKAFPDLGTHKSEYPAPYAIVYRNMAILGVQGFGSLPKNCLLLCYIFFASAIVINLIKDLTGKVGRFIPLPMAMAIPFYLGPYFAIDMCVGSLILFVWEKVSKTKADAFAPAVASGLICGDGIWTLPASILALFGVKPPICMKFLSRATNAKMFDEMPQKDVACWNTVISCYYQSGKFEDALRYFGAMRKFGFEPDSVTITTAISSCARLLDLDKGREIHKELVNSGFLLDSFISSALVDMYGKCGHLEMAIEVFEQMPKKTVVAWNSLITGYGLKGDSFSCIQLFKRMYYEGVKPTLTTLSSILIACSRSARLLEGKFVHGYMIRNRIQHDIFINTSLMDLYFKCGKVESAENIFKLIPKTMTVYWNVMISGYVTEGKFFEALGLFSEMRESYVEPDAITLTSVLAACSQLAALEKGKEIHNLIIERNLGNNEVVMGALLDMYAKCGVVDEAFGVFKCLPERDLVSWTTMITAYGSHGRVYEALELFSEMLQSNVKPDKVTFLAILSTCGHAGLVDDGFYHFNQMIKVYNITPRVEHYSCLIDLLGRAGRLHEAYEILKRNPEIKDDVGLLSTLLSACSLHRNLDLGVEVGKELINRDPNDSSTYVILSNMYAAVNKWDEVRMVRSKMKELGLKKNPGCSWIEINQKIQPFFVEDNSHYHLELVYKCLSYLTNHMEDECKPFTYHFDVEAQIFY